MTAARQSSEFYSILRHVTHPTKRAKEHLYLSYPIDIFDRATGMVLGKPSRFVEDFPSSVLGGMQVVEEEPEDPA